MVWLQPLHAADPGGAALLPRERHRAPRRAAALRAAGGPRQLRARQARRLRRRRAAARARRAQGAARYVARSPTSCSDS